MNEVIISPNPGPDPSIMTSLWKQGVATPHTALFDNYQLNMNEAII